MPSQLVITSVSPDECSFTLRHSSTAVSNSLRRILLAEIPTMAIDEVLVFENTGLMIDELLSSRLGLVPLVSTAANAFVSTTECTCINGCGRCQVMLDLVVTNPGDDHLLVTAASLRNVSDDLAIQQNPQVTDVVPVKYKSVTNLDAPVVLTKLSRGQTIQLLAKARKGVAKTHAKWSPVCTVACQPRPKVVLHKELLTDLEYASQEAIAKSCPTKVFRMGETLDIEDANRCMFCRECQSAATQQGVPNLLEIEPSSEEFDFTVESTGALPAREIVIQAVDVFRRKLESVRY